MAPKGGNGGSSSDGGDSSSSGSSSSSSSGYSYGGGGSDYEENPNPWFRKSDIEGYVDSYDIASTVFSGIFFIGLVGIAVFGLNVKSTHRNHEPVKAVLGWSRWVMAVVFGLIYYAFAFAVSIIQDAGAVVVNVYYIIQTILYSTVYPADIFLLFTVYTLLFHCFTKQGDDHRRKLKRNVFLAHGGFCAILGALYIAYLALSIQQTVQSVNDTLELEYRYYETIPAFHKVDVAFSALYFVASVEVLLATIYIFVTARKREIPSSLGAMLVALVGFPLFLRWIFVLSFAAAFELSHSNSLTIGGALAEEIIIGFSHLIVYFGVVLVAKQLPVESSKPWEATHVADQGPLTWTAPDHGSPQYIQQYPQKDQQQYAPPLANGMQHQHQQYYPQQVSPPQNLQQQHYQQYPTQQSFPHQVSPQSPQ